MITLGIDQGTSGTRTVAYQVEKEGLREVADAYQKVQTSRPREGWVEQDPEALLASVVETVSEVAETVGWSQIAAVGLANQGETTVAWNAGAEQPLAPAIVWQDRRTEPLLDELREADLAERILERSGLPLDPYFSSSKMTWLLRHHDAVQTAADGGTLQLGTSDAYLRARLSGQSQTDPATASRTQLLDLDTLTWDDWLADTFGIEPARLPEVVPTAGQLGELKHPDWPRALPLRAAIVDQQAALAGHGCFSAGQSKCTYGTGCFMLVNVGDTIPATDGRLLPTVAWTLNSHTDYALDGGVFTASAALDWLVDIGILDRAQDADEVAATVEDSGSVQFLPALAGLGAPWWRASAQGVIAGITGATRPGHIVRALLDGIAHRVCDIVEAVNAVSAEPLDRLRVDGGLTASRTLMQTQADLLGMPVDRSPAAEVTAFGAAGLAALGAGLIDDVAELRSLIPEPDVFTPRVDEDTRRGKREDWRGFLEEASQL